MSFILVYDWVLFYHNAFLSLIKDDGKWINYSSLLIIIVPRLYRPAEYLYSLREKRWKITIPNATETLSDSFLPCMGISKILSAFFNNAGVNPCTSSPKINAVVCHCEADNEIWVYGIDEGSCSSASILNPLRFNFPISRAADGACSHATERSAPKETFSSGVFGLLNRSSGPGVTPQK